MINKWAAPALVALVVGVLGALTPGCYNDWAFVRAARNQQETQLQQQLRQALDENAKLKQAVPK